MRTPHAIALANIPMFGQASHTKLLATFSTAEEVWNATRNDLLATGIPSRRLDAFLAWRNEHAPEEFVTLMNTHNIRLLGREDPEYPDLLAAIFDPPVYLFVQGAPITPNVTVAMVGSRHSTQYGKETAHNLAHQLALGGLCVVSGGAYGIDVASHNGAMAAGGKTLAVLASGLLAVDNPRQKMLNERILKSGGTLVSEFPLFAAPQKHCFPLRNRIVAGMCKATILVEAGLPSGSMITAEAATRENREVCAVPGNISSPTSAGTNFLIKTGAHCITEAEDVFQLYGFTTQSAKAAQKTLPQGRSAEEHAFFAVLSANPLHIDLIAEHAALPPTTASIIATQLELLGVIRDVGGRQFVRA